MHHKNKLITIGLITINLIGSALVCAAASSNGQVQVGPCTTECVTLNVPHVLSSVITPFIYDNSSKSAYFYSNSSLGQIVRISDARTNGNFELTATMSPLKTSDASPITIPNNDISILSFNENDGQSLDGYVISGGPMPTSDISPYQAGLTGTIFNESSYVQEIIDNNIPANYFRSFTCLNPACDAINGDSDPINIINANSYPSYLGYFTFGIGLKINLPENSLENLTIRDKSYTGTLTFTLNTAP